MILFWRAWGWLVVPLTVAPTIGGVAIARASGWTEGQGAGTGLLLGGVILTLVAFIALPRSERGFWHAQRLHSFMFVPVLVWAPIVMVLGVLTMLL